MDHRFTNFSDPNSPQEEIPFDHRNPNGIEVFDGDFEDSDVPNEYQSKLEEVNNQYQDELVKMEDENQNS
jgi:regulator of protease activity HflC (stomatin/prohibitin superfamily)